MAIPALSTEHGDGFFRSIARYQELIAQVLAFSDFRKTPIPWEPAADSDAMAELADEATYVHVGDSAPVAGTFGKAGLLMLAAEDHLDSLSGLFRPPAEVSIFTPAVVLRATLETLGRAHWLIDPSIGVKRRVGRNMTESLHQAHHRRLLLSGQDRKDYDRQFDRPALLASAKRMNYKVEKDSEGGWYVGEPRPGAKKAIDRVFNGAAREILPGTIFRSTSAVSHASLHGILSQVEIDAGAGVGQVSVATVSTDDVKTKELLAVALHAYIVVSVARRQHLGWVDEGWEDTVRRVGQLMVDTFEPHPAASPPRPSGLHLPTYLRSR